jgi:hypothetical protein
MNTRPQTISAADYPCPRLAGHFIFGDSSMTNPFITINAYPLIASSPGRFSIELGIGKDCPKKRVAIRNVADCKTALHAFAAELKATQKPWRLMTSFDDKSGRKPNGFAKAQAARELEQNVNEHLAGTGES